MRSIAVFASIAVLTWAGLLALLLRAVPRRAWPAVLGGSALTVLAGAVAATWKYPSWEAVLIVLGLPAIAIVVTAGHPVRILDPKWTYPEEEITEEAEAVADRYAWRAVLAVIVSVVVLTVAFGW